MSQVTDQSHGRALAGKAMTACAAQLGAGRGGLARQARLWTRALIEAGADVRLSCLNEAGPLSHAGRTVRCAGGNRLRLLAGLWRDALAGVPAMYDANTLARAEALFWPLRRNYAVWLNGIDVWQHRDAGRVKALDRAALRIAISEHTRRRFHALHGEDKTTELCWLGTEEDDAPPPSPPHAGPPEVLILARIDARENYKGHKELIAAWPQVVAQVPGAVLTIAGGGNGLEALRRHTAASGAAAQIRLTGFVPEHETPALFQRASVFAMPSRDEGFGLVYVEAMRFGLPVIASVHDAGSEVSVHGETGLNVDLDRPGGLADALIGLLTNEAQRRAMGDAAQARWQRHFRYGAFRDRFLTLMERHAPRFFGRRP